MPGRKFKRGKKVVIDSTNPGKKKGGGNISKFANRMGIL